jgi:uncharacterized protein YndB with AHSA1/START domain
LRTTIDINASPQTVWDIVTDLEQLGDWVTIHRDFPEPPPSDVAEGAHFKQTLTVAGTPFEVAWTAETVQEPERLHWTGTGPAGSVATTSYELAASNGGTRFGYDNEFSLPGGKVGDAAAGVVSGAAERETSDSLAKLKALAER